MLAAVWLVSLESVLLEDLSCVAGFLAGVDPVTAYAADAVLASLGAKVSFSAQVFSVDHGGLGLYWRFLAGGADS